MLKKIILFFVIFFSFFSINYAWEDCIFYSDDLNGNLTEKLEKCINDWNFWWVIPPWDNLDLAHWESFWESLKIWSEKIAILVGSLAVLMIVYAWFLLVISTWDEEKIKKAKDILKWTILWFIWLLMAWLIVMLIVKLWYFFWNI
jgi:hypothetical protein